MYETFLGTDKIGHFFDMGHTYFKANQRGVRG